jgi:enoyl-CoA hydratase
MSFPVRQASLRRSLSLATTSKQLSIHSTRFITTAGSKYKYILTSRPDPTVSLITLNRPEALNALSSPLMKEVCHALQEADADKEVGAIVLTGSEKAFAGQPNFPCCAGSILIRVVI